MVFDDKVVATQEQRDGPGREPVPPASAPAPEKSRTGGTALVIVPEPNGAEAFDYAELAGEVAEAAREAAVRIRNHLGCELLAMVEAGGELVKVKELLGHGRFGAWLRSEFAMSERTAGYYMQIFRAFGEDFATVADLPLVLLRELSRPAIPEEIRRAFVDRAVEGRPPTIVEIRTAATRRREGEGTGKPSSPRSTPARRGRRRCSGLRLCYAPASGEISSSSPRLSPPRGWRGSARNCSGSLRRRGNAR